jgi:hypothetical protein
MRYGTIARVGPPLFAVLMAGHAAAQTPVHLWSSRFGDSSAQYGYAVTTASGTGFVFVAGEFNGTIDLGGGPLTSAGGTDVFLAKFSHYGGHLWSMSFGDASQQAASAVSTDDAGNVYMIGRYGGVVNFGGGNLTSAGSWDMFVVKFNSAGVHQWSRSFGGVYDEFCNALAVDGTGNVHITGEFPVTIDFGGGVLTSAGGNDVFLAKLNSPGSHLWSKRFGDSSYQYAHGVAVDGSGDVCVTGEFLGSINFGGSDLASAGIHDIYLARLDGSGAHLWSKRFGDPANQLGQSVSFDGYGNAYFAGHITGSADFGGGLLTSAGSYDAVVAKFDAAGTHQWSRRVGDGSYQYVTAMSVSPLGDVFLAGHFAGTMDFGGGPLTSSGASDAFLAKLATSGAHRWSQRFGDANNQIPHGVALRSAGGAHMVGEFEGSINFGGNVLVSAGQHDVFLASFDDMPREPVISSITDIGNDQGRKVKVRFDRTGFDAYGSSTPIVRYDAFRRDDAIPSVARRVPPMVHEFLAGGWTQVGSVAAYGDPSYGIDVPTVGDSTIASGQYYSVFFIRAATTDPMVYYQSPADSGYSLDNLAPAVPSSFAYTTGTLSWDESSASDFDYFSVYGGSTSSFATATLVDYCVAPTMDVSTSPYVYYFVTATDFAGNEGKAAMVNTLSGVGGTPKSYVLSISACPNPFNPRTTIRYTVPSKGRVTIEIFDARGVRVTRLVDTEREGGAFTQPWDGRDGSGRLVSSGVYFARVAHPSGTKSYKMVMVK